MEVTVITTISRRIAVVGEYADICEIVEQAMIEAGASPKAFNYIICIEYPNVFAAYNDFLPLDFRTQNRVNTRIFTDTITDISQVII